MDLNAVIQRILGGSLVFGIGVACNCPPQAPDFTVTTSNEPFVALLEESTTMREDSHCEAVCDAGFADEEVDYWTCTFLPIERADRVECQAPTDAEPREALALIDLELEVEIPEAGLDNQDCEAVCKTTRGWTVAQDIGVLESSIWCSDIEGDRLEDAAMDCRFGSECIGGRRPCGEFPARASGAGMGAWWAEMAQLEHVSILAFEELARDLAAHGAPHALVRRARAAADDERRHVVLCVERARANGVEPHLVDATPSPVPTLDALARQNAREGCVREAYAALEAGWQARHAAAPADRATLQTIHTDEVRHGQLAYDIHAWASEHVDLTGCIASAFATLVDIEPRRLPGLGLPTPDERRALIDALRQAA